MSDIPATLGCQFDLALGVPTDLIRAASAGLDVVQAAGNTIDAVEALEPFAGQLVEDGNVSLVDPFAAIADPLATNFWLAQGSWARANRDVVPGSCGSWSGRGPCRHPAHRLRRNDEGGGRHRRLHLADPAQHQGRVRSLDHTAKCLHLNRFGLVSVLETHLLRHRPSHDMQTSTR